MMESIDWRRGKFMKSKNYESFFSVWILFFLFCFFMALVFIFSVGVSNIRKYEMIPGMVSSKNQVMLIVSSKQLEWFYHNKVVLIDGKKTSFSIDRVLRNLSLNRHKKVHQIFLSVSIKGYLVNDSISIGCLQKRVSFVSIFFEMWKGG